MQNTKSSLSAMVICLILLFVITSFGSGCGSSYPAKSANMIPESYEINKKHSSYVQITVKGEKANEIGPFGDEFPISNEEFKKALEQAIKDSEIFLGCVEDGKAEYLIEINIGTLTPGDIKDWDVQMILAVNWALVEKKMNKVIWKDMIVTSHETPITAESNGNERLRMTNEGAVRDNIKRGLSEISRIELKN